MLVANRVYADRSKEEVKPYVVRKVPQIEIVDGMIITDTVRKQAKELID